MLTDETEQLLEKVEKLKKELASMRPLSRSELERLESEWLFEYTYDSNAIEGSTLTLDETVLLLRYQVTISEKPLSYQLDAVGHRDAFIYIKNLVNSDFVFTEREIKDIHRLVYLNGYPEDRGVYRKLDVFIGGSEDELAKPFEIKDKMEQLIQHYDTVLKKGNMIKAVSEFHLMFENIHPFLDGNGRTGRLILNLELMRAKYLPINIKFKDRRKYLDCFKDYHKNNKNASSFINLVAGYQIEELENHISIVKEANRLKDKLEGDIDI